MRHARLLASGIPFHVLQRGINRNACFLATADYHYFLAQLGALSEEHGIAIHAYVLMTNHFHLLVTPGSAIELSRMMKRLTQRHCQRLNRLHERSGTMWQGRFKSSLVGQDDYFLACQRYIELNPVRAGMVTAPGQYAWSSYRANADGEASALLTSHPVYENLGADPDARRTAYRDLFVRELDPDIVGRLRRAAIAGLVVGSSSCVGRVQTALGRSVLPRGPGRSRT